MTKMYIFLSGLLKTWRGNSPCNMDQIHLVKYSITKRLGDKTIQKSHNVELQLTYPGVNILVFHVWTVLLLDGLASPVGVTLFSLDATTTWASTVGPPAVSVSMFCSPQMMRGRKSKGVKRAKALQLHIRRLSHQGYHSLTICPWTHVWNSCSFPWSGTFQALGREST